MADVTIYYLELPDAELGVLKPVPADLHVAEACVKQYQVNRMLYELVGEGWQWTDRLKWTSNMWQDYAESDSVRTWIAMHRGSIAGYFELQQQEPGITEIAYFGLAEKFIGYGYGGSLLSEAVRQAWQWGSVEKVIVNTCTLDHPNALANYKARGFTVVREKQVSG